MCKSLFYNRAGAVLLFATAWFLGGCAAPISVPHGASSTSFYISAHPDDIELFMGRNAWRDIEADAPRVVFLVLTAGDAGLAMDYTLARESGHERAIRFWAGLNGKPLAGTVSAPVQIGEVQLVRHAIGARVVVYNLRLPDGNPDGTGYAVTGNESLKLLRDRAATARIHSVDGQLTLSYAQLKELIAGILLREAKGSREVWVNIQDEDQLRNPLDHSDHTATALTVLDVVREARFSCIGIARYLDYVTALKGENMDPADRRLHAGTWGALNSGRVDGLQASTWDPVHVAWLGREYLRVEPPGGPCAL
jgi:LmbE family N-acetylglucosaminyl deacetylase